MVINDEATAINAVVEIQEQLLELLTDTGLNLARLMKLTGSLFGAIMKYH